ncbi:MAG: efflux RND transporter periplasmic adaptor subunit [Phycisphaerae bacterium]
MKKTVLRLSAGVVLAAAGYGMGILFPLTGSRRVYHGPTGPGVGAAVAKATPLAASHKKKILYWWDPMLGPSSISSKPGISAMGMKLIPVYAPARGMQSGGVLINPIIRQDMGVQTATAILAPLRERIRTVGYFRRAAPQVADVVLRVDGYLGRLFVATNGQTVTRGEKLFTLYSPKLVFAEKEMLAAFHAWKSARKHADTLSASTQKQLFHSLVKRLLYLGVPGRDIRRIVSNGHAETYLTFYSPAGGVAEQICLRQKSAVRRGEALMKIVNLSSLWIDAHVYDRQMAWVASGDRMTVDPDSEPGSVLHTHVNFIAPVADPISHTVVVRGNISNDDGRLRPGMTAVVDITTRVQKQALLIPRDAVIESGTRDIVFVASGHGHFDPVRITVGPDGEHGMVSVLSGIGPGERVVTSGEFLIDVESQLRSALTAFTAPSTGHHRPRTDAGHHKMPDAVRHAAKRRKHTMPQQPAARVGG